MTTIRRIPTSKIDGNNSNSTDENEIRPYGEIAVYVGDNNKLELLMFDGVRTHLRSKVLNKGTFYGGDADSGDGAGLDTIKLVPDEVLRRSGSDQYLIIDPTEPDHIHIRAGGTVDNSNAALILGGENSNVEIQAGENPPVYVRANNNTWMFDTDGSLILPTGVTNNGRISNINGISLAVDTGFWIFGTDGALTIPGDIRSESDINITVNSEDSSSYTWNFGQTGNLIFPDDTVQSTAYTGLLTTAAATGGVEFNLSTALDLTKAIQKLTAGYYSLADGVEGQIMYFVPVNGVTQGSSVGIVMANVRQFVNGTVAVINNAWFPFFQNAIIDDENPEAFNASTIAYAIFTDGAWNVFGGGMD